VTQDRLHMPNVDNEILVILDDRETTNDDISPFVGLRRYGDITYRRRKLTEYFVQSLPAWATANLCHLRDDRDVIDLRRRVENAGKDVSFFVVASRAGISNGDTLRQLIERLPYAEDSFTDRLYKPLVVFFKSSHVLLDRWDDFVAHPLHRWEKQWKDMEKVVTLQPCDLGNIRDFLFFMTGSTEPRHFNEVHIDSYYYTKSSTDREKIKAEYEFYALVPEKMRPWLMQPFDFHDDGSSASYKMMRHYVSDAALQWVHGAFDPASFGSFIDRLLFFLAERPTKKSDKSATGAAADKLFLDKLVARRNQFLGLEEGLRINNLVTSADPKLGIDAQLERYKKLYDKYRKQFVTDHLVVGHGDPCFSNILYDQQRYLMKLIDPKGAKNESELWTHPLYDLCKISHSVLGDYDFINNGLYDMSLDGANKIYIRIHEDKHDRMKLLFREKLAEQGFDGKHVRLGEASLFLSMLPLHIDHPNKVMAFMLIAKRILDEVEHG
jgi:hypothetical protein